MHSRAAAFVAHRRVVLGFVLGVLVYWLAAPSRATLGVGAVIGSLGEALRFWAAGHLQKSREVTTSGPYAWVAHPLYVGSSVMAAGLVVACGSLVVGAVIALYVLVVLPTSARRESAFLRRTFPEGYERYRRGDRSAGPTGGESRRFSFAQALANREHRALIGLLAAMLLLAMKVRG